MKMIRRKCEEKSPQGTGSWRLSCGAAPVLDPAMDAAVTVEGVIERPLCIPLRRRRRTKALRKRRLMAGDGPPTGRPLLPCEASKPAAFVWFPSSEPFSTSAVISPVPVETAEAVTEAGQSVYGRKRTTRKTLSSAEAEQPCGRLEFAASQLLARIRSAAIWHRSRNVALWAAGVRCIRRNEVDAVT